MRRLDIHNWAMAAVLLGLWGLLGVLPQTREFFLTDRNLGNLMTQVSHIAVIAVGMTLVIVIRGIDLSVGAGVALTGVVAALLQIDYGMPAWVAVGGALAMGLAVGMWQGLWIARFNIPAFVVTLAGFNAFRGIALVLSDARGLSPMHRDFSALSANLPVGVTVAGILVVAAGGAALAVRDARRRVALDLARVPGYLLGAKAAAIAALAAFLLFVFGRRGMPVPVALAGLAVIGGVLLSRKTRIGRHIYAIGGNPEAARLAGVPVFRTTVFVYALVGVLTAVGGVILAARTNGVTPGNAGNLLELDVITAVVIGGTSLFGGRGSVVGSLLGALLLGTLSSGMNALEIDSNWQLIVKGSILIAAALVDVASKRNRT
jgi:D-xylose transport system permease protein